MKLKSRYIILCYHLSQENPNFPRNGSSLFCLKSRRRLQIPSVIVLFFLRMRINFFHIFLQVPLLRKLFPATSTTSTVRSPSKVCVQPLYVSVARVLERLLGNGNGSDSVIHVALCSCLKFSQRRCLSLSAWVAVSCWYSGNANISSRILSRLASSCWIASGLKAFGEATASIRSSS